MKNIKHRHLLKLIFLLAVACHENNSKEGDVETVRDYIYEKTEFQEGEILNSTDEDSRFYLEIDEHFEGDSLNEQWEAASHGFPENLCRFDPKQVEILDGFLNLHVTKDDQGNLWCGEIRSKASFLYGKVQTRLRSNPGQRGFVSSIFFFSDTIPQYWRELDIELEGQHDGQVHTNLISGNDCFVCAQLPKKYLLPGFSHSNNYHFYEIEWLPTIVRYYVDGFLLREIFDTNKIPHQPMKIMMNFWISALGDAFGGDPKQNSYPMVAHYDWVRFYSYRE